MKIGVVVHRAQAARAQKARRERDPEKHRQARFANRLKNDYGLTVQEYLDLIAKQGGGCAICHDSLTAGLQVHTDHCHTSGRVRGILCQKCNIGLGHFRDDTKLLRAAIYYLIDPPNS